MCNFRSKIPREDGFIAIVALGILSLLTIFIVILATTTNTTNQNLRTTKDFYVAQNVANSILEDLELQLADKDFGYNLDQTCETPDFGIGTTSGTNAAIPTTDPQKAICAKLAPFIKSQGVNAIEVNFKIVGRPLKKTETQLTSADSNTTIKPKYFFEGSYQGIAGNQVFVVPAPATGSAGQNCNLYLEDLNDDKDGSTSENKLALKVNDKGQIQNEEGVSQLDYSCNWGRLTLGSSATDRVAIPFYYATDDGIVNPFNKNASDKATSFLVRLRTPCIASSVKGSDKTNCSDSQRYILNEDDGNDIVVQWQLTGTCPLAGGKEEECGLVADVVNDDKGKILVNESSAIAESLITYFAHEVLKIENLGKDINNNKEFKIYNKIQVINKPIFTLFLNKKLLTKDNKKIPYLEYQVLTDKPIGNAEAKLEVEITVNGTKIKKTITKEIKKDLIDFAIQNWKLFDKIKKKCSIMFLSIISINV